jgi:hypothetical protein
MALFVPEATPASRGGTAPITQLATVGKQSDVPHVPGAGPRVQAALAHLTPAPALDAVLGLGTGMPRRP